MVSILLHFSILAIKYHDDLGNKEQPGSGLPAPLMLLQKYETISNGVCLTHRTSFTSSFYSWGSAEQPEHADDSDSLILTRHWV